jgi:hemerythrin superfamily protein
LVPHTKAEEKIVYDAVLALKGITAKGGMATRGISSMASPARLWQVGEAHCEYPEFKATARVLKELVDHHIKEESNIWGRVKENFSDEQRAEMNRDFLSAKKKVKVS